MRWALAAAVAALAAGTMIGSFVILDNGAVRWHHIIGLAIAIPALAMWVLARRELGSSFAVLPEARRLVTTGIYSRIRHPVYIFGWLFIGGLLTFMGALPVLVLLVPLGLLQIWRARREERVLEAAFGDEYRRYRDTTWP